MGNLTGIWFKCQAMESCPDRERDEDKREPMDQKGGRNSPYDNEIVNSQHILINSHAILDLCEKELSEMIRQKMWLNTDGEGSYITYLETVVMESALDLESRPC